MIELTDWLRDELVRRRSQEEPDEACGLISRDGDEGGGISLWAAENVHAESETHFEIADDNLIAIMQQIEARGETLVGIYHSHEGSPRPSPADVAAAAQWPGLTWVIVGTGACFECDGGVIIGVEPECCGNTTTSGECRGDCAVPAPVEEQCSVCGGDGILPDFWVGVLA